jgi:hypothetical protein
LRRISVSSKPCVVHACAGADVRSSFMNKGILKFYHQCASESIDFFLCIARFDCFA